jgi:hypothetical protein
MSGVLLARVCTGFFFFFASALHFEWMNFYQVLIVDDGSVDGTKRAAFNFVRKYTVDNVRVILLGRNHGKGEAIRKVSLILTIHLQTCSDVIEGSMFYPLCMTAID